MRAGLRARVIVATCLLLCLPAGHLTALDLLPRAIHPGESIQSALPEGDPYDTVAVFTLEPGAAGPITIDARSAEFDVWLTVRGTTSDGTPPLIREDYDGGGGTDSRIVLTAAAGESYHIEVRSADHPGCGSGFLLVVTSGATAPVFREQREAVDIQYWDDVAAHADATGSADCRSRALVGSTRALHKWGHYEEAFAAGGEAIAFARQQFGPGDRRVAPALLAMLMVEYYRGDLENGRRLGEEALQIYRGTLGPEHPAAAIAMRTLGLIIGEAGDNEGAMRLYRDAREILEEQLGTTHPETLETVNAIGHAYGWNDRDIKLGRRLLERVLALREARLSPDDIRTAETLRGLSEIIGLSSRADESAPYAERALEIAEKVLGPEHPETAWPLAVMAQILSHQGDYAAALPFFERTMSIVRASFPNNQSYYIYAFAILATHYDRIGAYPEAKALFQEALERERLHGDPGGVWAVALMIDLGELFVNLGAYSEAGALAEEGLRVARGFADPDNVKIAHAYGLLGVVRHAEGAPAEAERLLMESLRQTRALYGDVHRYVSGRQRQLADLYTDLGRHAEAVDLYAEAVAGWRALYGNEHPGAAPIVTRLAEALLETGDVEAARRQAVDAVALLEDRFGGEHHWLAEALGVAASIEAAEGNYSTALDRALQAERVGANHLQLTAEMLSEKLSLEYAAARRSSLDLALSLLADGIGGRKEAARVWDGVIRSRALVIDVMAARHRASGRTGDPEVDRIREELSTARSRLARTRLRGPDGMTVDAYEKLIDALRREKESAEEALASRSPDFRQERPQGEVGFDRVLGALPAGTALLAYVAYERSATTPPRGESAHDVPAPAPHYIAFIARAGRRGVRAVPLGPADVIDRWLAEWKEEVSREPSPFAAVRRKNEDDYLDAGTELRRAIWDPVSGYLGATSQLFIITDRKLNFVNLGTLPTEPERFLVETGPRMHYLSAERDLVPGVSDAPGAKGLLIVGAPDFDLDPAATTTHLAQLAPDIGMGPVYRGPAPTCTEFNSHRFAALPGAGRELREIAAIWEGRERVTTLDGPRALETAFKRGSAGYRNLHIATHAFFIEDQCRGNSGEAGAAPGPNDALLFSGLALAGANRRDSIEITADIDDGILTAEEIASLDLEGVEWVVLSACDTGAGESVTGEGVLGLRRAFQVAGADTVIMSLWKVRDDAVGPWMERLYRERLNGRTTPEAMRRATLTELAAAREAGRSTHPFYWGAFVATGAWR